MFSDGARLFAGTLKGVWVLDLNTQKWTHLNDALPSEVVLSITGTAENVYFGTTGGIARINQRFWQNV
jgi:ligand-binding sensor domain-containing protein